MTRSMMVLIAPVAQLQASMRARARTCMHMHVHGLYMVSCADGTALNVTYFHQSDS